MFEQTDGGLQTRMQKCDKRQAALQMLGGVYEKHIRKKVVKTDEGTWAIYLEIIHGKQEDRNT